jgi:hypothetical protein
MPRNGCFDRPQGRPSYFAQDGYIEVSQPFGHVIRTPKWVVVEDTVMSKDCRHSALKVDPACEGCKHNQRGMAAPTEETQ